MDNLAALEQQAADLQAQLKAMADRSQMLKQTLRAVRKEIATLKKAEKKRTAPMNTVGIQLRDAQAKIRAVRVAAAAALRARGATIAEVEQILGASYTVIRSAEDRAQREARREQRRQESNAEVTGHARR